MFEDDENIELNQYEQLPLYKKGEEIRRLVEEIVDLIDDKDEMLAEMKWILLADAHLLTVKIAGAEAGDLYDIRMECAAFIRKAGNDLMVNYNSLVMFGFEHADYYKMVRQLLDEYRMLFAEWVAGFDRWNYLPDSWGLFNPPGVEWE